MVDEVLFIGKSIAESLTGCAVWSQCVRGGITKVVVAHTVTIQKVLKEHYLTFTNRVRNMRKAMHFQDSMQLHSIMSKNGCQCAFFLRRYLSEAVDHKVDLPENIPQQWLPECEH
jgi:hypothetical protein